MLVIERYPHQKVMIGDDIVIWPTINSHGHAVINTEIPTGLAIEQVGDVICIGDDIAIRVLSIRSYHNRKLARIGFDAPREIPIWREEIYNSLQTENKRSAA